MLIEIELPHSTFQDSTGRSLKKKVQIKRNPRNYDEDVAACLMTLKHYKVEKTTETLVSEGFYAPKDYEFVASNKFKVDANGVRTTDGSGTPEFDYYRSLKNSAIRTIQKQLVKKGISIQYTLPDDPSIGDHDLALLEIQVYQLQHKGAFE